MKTKTMKILTIIITILLIISMGVPVAYADPGTEEGEAGWTPAPEASGRSYYS